MIKAVIFDLGGVLVRTENKVPRTQLAERYGLSYAEIDRLVFNSEIAARATVGEIDVSEVWQHVCSSLEVPGEMAAEIEEQFWAGDTLDERLVGFIRSLRPRWKTALLSNAWSSLRATLRDHWKIVDDFDELIISAEAGMAKPDPRAFALAVNRLGVQPEEAVFVDDFPENIEAAERAGLKGVRFLNTDQAIADVRALLEE